MASVRGAHLVGSLTYPDAESAMIAAAENLGGLLRRIPDGEPGDRFHWIMFQPDVLAHAEGIERVGGSWSVEEEAAFKQPTIDMFARQSHPLYASARLWDDGIVDPRKTRDVLALSLSAALNAPVDPTRFGVFRM